MSQGHYPPGGATPLGSRLRRAPRVVCRKAALSGATDSIYSRVGGYVATGASPWSFSSGGGFATSAGLRLHQWAYIAKGAHMVCAIPSRRFGDAPRAVCRARPSGRGGVGEENKLAQRGYTTQAQILGWAIYVRKSQTRNLYILARRRFPKKKLCISVARGAYAAIITFRGAMCVLSIYAHIV